MAKKVVVICASPRKMGNSELLADQFMAGALKFGHRVEKICLNEYHISPCLACEFCRNNNRVCKIEDDCAFIIQKLIDADVMVFASPVYFYSISAQLKMLIDRFFAREYEIRTSSKQRKAYLILTSGSKDVDQMVGSVESFRGFIRVLRTVDEGGIIYGLGAFKKEDALTHPAYAQAYDVGYHLEKGQMDNVE